MIAVAFKWAIGSQAPPHIHHGAGAAIITGGLFGIAHYDVGDDNVSDLTDKSNWVRSGEVETIPAGGAHTVKCLFSGFKEYGTSIHVYHINEDEYSKFNEFVKADIPDMPVLSAL